MSNRKHKCLLNLLTGSCERGDFPKSGLASGLLFASFQIGGGIVLAAASAVFGAAPNFGWDLYVAGVAFVALLAIAITLLAAAGPRTSAVRRPAYQAAE